jgi:hypothetical protein
MWLGQDLDNKSCAYVTTLLFQQLFWNQKTFVMFMHIDAILHQNSRKT